MRKILRDKGVTNYESPQEISQHNIATIRSISKNSQGFRLIEI